MSAPDARRARREEAGGVHARNAALLILSAACGCLDAAAAGRHEAPLRPAPPAGPAAGAESFPVPPPPLSKKYFPCSDCHDANLPVNPARRELTEDHRKIVLTHDEEHRWCLDCHDPDDRDVLRLASGSNVRFEESYKLCGQCHGPTFRDWKVGIHGKRTGMWNGAKQYLLCAHCHDPHAPRFKPLRPEPPPVRPEEIR